MKKVYDNMLVPYDWYAELARDIDSNEPNWDLGQKRLWYLYLSLRSGELFKTGDPIIDYPVSNFFSQAEKMRKELDNEDVIIAKMRDEGKTSDQIGDFFGITGGAIRRKEGWKKYKEILKSVEM